ncbi:MAG: Hint domain-containing protein [Sandaracinaceae bacterium]|nr:Hint domain-containing protein [Sandaracinaceae bacterium]
MCAWGAVCASPDTPIATPEGERAIAELAAGDLVYSVHEGALVAVPIERVSRTPVGDHAVVRVALASGRVLEISARHPTADGRTFGDLAPGEALDGVGILEVETVPYEHGYTHDILPASDSGTYVAGGVLIGTTLAR